MSGFCVDEYKVTEKFVDENSSREYYILVPSMIHEAYVLLISIGCNVWRLEFRPLIPVGTWLYWLKITYNFWLLPFDLWFFPACCLEVNNDNVLVLLYDSGSVYFVFHIYVFNETQWTAMYTTISLIEGPNKRIFSLMRNYSRKYLAISTRDVIVIVFFF